MNVNVVATREDLANELLSEDALVNVCADSTKVQLALQNALNDALAKLKLRKPPITEGMLSDPSELRSIVINGALRRLHEGNITTGVDDRNSILAKRYSTREKDELQALTPTVGSAVLGPPGSIAVHRR